MCAKEFRLLTSVTKTSFSVDRLVFRHIIKPSFNGGTERPIRRNICLSLFDGQTDAPLCLGFFTDRAHVSVAASTVRTSAIP